MKSAALLLCLSAIFASATAFAQAVPAPVDAKVCDITNHPKDFDGKVVRLTGTVQVGVDSLLVRADTCTSPLWLSLPAGTKATLGPATVLTLQLAANSAATPAPGRPSVTLERNKDFETFNTLLSLKVKTPGMCLGCVKNNVTATLVGRIDGTEDPGIKRDSAGKVTGLDGFGNMNQYGARMVLMSVANPVAKEIDFSKLPKVKDDNQGSNDKDYVGLTRKTEAAFAKGTAAPEQIEAALGAYGAPGVDNGVVVAFGATAEVPAGEGSKAAASSPDGLVLTVRFDPDRLKGDALSRAAAHQGAELLALRSSTYKPLGAIEQQAFQTMLLVIIGARQKSLTLPGGTLFWNADWPEAERTAKASEALSLFLTDHEQAH